MSQYPTTISELHKIVDGLACIDDVSSDFIGPRPITSRFLGDAAHVAEGLSSETVLPIMVRCVFPPNTQSRHAVIPITRSMGDKELAAILYHVFDLKPLEGIIMNTGVQCPGPRLAGLTFREALGILGNTKCGMLRLMVISETEFACCPNCGHQADLDVPTVQRVRAQCVTVRRLCLDCVKRSGVTPDSNDMAWVGNTQVFALRG